MGLESQSAINPRHKSRPIKADQPSIAWIKFITPSSSFGPSLERPVLELAQISWISPLSASLIFLDLALVIGPTGTCTGSLNALWCSSTCHTDAPACAGPVGGPSRWSCAVCMKLQVLSLSLSQWRKVFFYLWRCGRNLGQILGDYER